MLTQQEADRLIALLKKLMNKKITFPRRGTKISLGMVSGDNKDEFLLDINRSGIVISKCTYQTRYNKEIILLRLDINGTEHTNPDGTVLSENHLHVYKEGSGDKWAIDLEGEALDNINDLISTLIFFLEKNNVDMQNVFIQGGMFNGGT